jgi:Uma2 family endonuclease
MGMPALPTSGWTVDMLATLPDDGNRYEIIGGVLLVTPSPARLHQRAVGELLALLRTYVNAIGGLEALDSPADIRAGRDTSIQPDVFVARLQGDESDREWPDVSSLALAIEVVSPSSARADRHEKRRLYQRERVAEYWAVDLDSRVVERWRPEDHRPEILVDRLEWRPEEGPASLTIDLGRFFRRVFGE